jgi:ferredoxin
MIGRTSELPEAVEAKCSECRLRVRVSLGEQTYSDDPELLVLAALPKPEPS